MFVTSRTVKVEGIVLRATAWREKDRLLALLTRERGRLWVVAQGAQRPQNRLAPIAQTGVWATFWLARGREFDRVTDARWGGIGLQMRKEATALAAFGIVAEILERVVPAEAPDPALFEEVRDALLVLDLRVPTHKWLTTVLVRLLLQFGWLPPLLTCVRCGERFGDQQEVIFAPSADGSLCLPCSGKQCPPDGQRVAVATLHALDALVRQPKLMTTLHLRLALWQQALALLRMMWRYHLESDLRAWQVWEQCRRSSPTALLPQK